MFPVLSPEQFSISVRQSLVAFEAAQGATPTELRLRTSTAELAAGAHFGTVTISTGGGGRKGHIYVTTTDGSETLASPSKPAVAGAVVVIYCSGLGVVTTPVNAGGISTGSSNSITVSMAVRYR